MSKIVGPMIENSWTQDEIEFQKEEIERMEGYNVKNMSVVVSDFRAAIDTVEEAQIKIMTLQAEVMQLNKRKDGQQVVLDSMPLDTVLPQFERPDMNFNDVLDEVTLWGTEWIGESSASTLTEKNGKTYYTELLHCYDVEGRLYIMVNRDRKTKQISSMFLTRSEDTAKSKYIEMSK